MDLNELAPGVGELGETLGLLWQALSMRDFRAIFDPSRVESYATLVLIIVPLWLLLCLVIAACRPKPLSERERARKAETADDDNRPTNNSLWRRLLWKLRPPVDMMRVDGLTIPRTGKDSHTLWLGPTGSGKSAGCATLRVDGKRPTLIVTPDYSDPMINETLRLGGYRWTACKSSIPVDFLIGTPEEVAERLTEVFQSGGTGLWKITARLATTKVIVALDDQGIQRSLLTIGQALLEAASASTPQSRELYKSCSGWITRFLSTADQFGGSMGSDGIDIATLLREGRTVLLDNDAMEHPGLRGDVVAFGLSEAKRCANLVPGGFRLIFEEAQQLADRIELADPFFLAGRRRGIAVDAISQSEAALDDAITQNARTRFYFSQELRSLQKTAADRLGLDPNDIGWRMKDWHAWVSNGKIRRLVKLPKPRPPVADGISSTVQVGVTGGSARMGVERGLVVYEYPYQGSGEPVEYQEYSGPRMLPPPSIRHEKLLEGAVRDGSCLRWRADLRHDKDGYGEIWISGEGYRKVHRIAFELAYGSIPRNPDGTTQTVDHIRGICFHKDCFELTHLRLLSRGDNSADSHRGRGRMNRQARVGGSGGRKAKS